MALLLVLQLITGIIVSPVGTFFPVYLSDIGYQAVFIAGVFTLQRVMGLVSSLAGGSLCDFLGRKRTLVLGQVGYLVTGLVFLFRAPAAILPLWALYGVGMTFNTLGSQGYLMDAAKARSLGVLTALYYWGYTLGGAIGNPLAALLIDRAGYAGLTVGLSVLGAGACAVAALALPRSDHEKDLRQERVLGRRGPAGLPGFGDLARRPAVLVLALLRFLPTFCYGILAVFAPLLLKQAGATGATIALYATAASLCAALIQLVVGKLADRRGPRIPSVVAYLLFGASALGVGLGSNSLGWILVCGVLATSAAWSLSVLTTPLVVLGTAATERGRVLGFIHLAWNLAMIAGSMLGGILFEVWGGLPFLAGAAAAFSAAPLVALYLRLVRSERHSEMPTMEGDG